MSELSRPWTRHGLLLPVKPSHRWWKSHAQSPTVLVVSPRRWRIYFAGRDGGNRASILAVDVDPRNDMRVLAEHLDPMLADSPRGTFDCAGLGPSCALPIDGRVQLFYSGVQPRSDVKFQIAIGLAVSDDGLSFERKFVGPIRSIGPTDPYFVSTPFVRPVEGGYRMWYTSGTGWEEHDGTLEPTYVLRSCRSRDGIVWETGSSLVLPDDADGRFSQTRPWISRDNDSLRLWYSQRGRNFRSSGDEGYRLYSCRLGVHGDFAGDVQPVVFDNPPAAGEFDSWMQAYACVMRTESREILFYNGDEFGKAGIGWATRSL
jgi:hypothetical protein